MIRLFGGASLAIVMLYTQALGSEWKHYRINDAFDGVSESVIGNAEAKSGALLQLPGPELVVTKNKAGMAVLLRELVPFYCREDISIRYKIDDSPPESLIWKEISERVYWVTSRNFLENLLKGKKLLVRIEGCIAPLTEIWSLEGFAAAVGQIQ